MLDAPEFLPELARVCVLLPVVAAAAWFINKQHMALRAAEAKRVTDLMTIVDRLIEVSKTSAAAISEQAHVLDNHNEVLKEVREALRELERK